MTNLTIRSLEEDDFEALCAIRRFAFLDDTDYDEARNRRELLEYMAHMAGGFIDEELVVAGAMLPLEMYHGGRSVPVGGLASVVSAAEHRRRGHVRQLLRPMLAKLRDDGVGWCLQYPFNLSFYAQFGWQTIVNGLFAEVSADHFRDGVTVDGVRRFDPEDDDDIAAVDRIYESWARQFNFTMNRSHGVHAPWRHIHMGDPRRLAEKGQFGFLIDDVAYCDLAIRRDDERKQVARVLDWAYTTSRGRRQLLRLWGTLSGQLDRFELQFPVDDPLSAELTTHLVASPHPVQLRIVDVVSALTGIRCTSPVDTTVAVEDSFCDWNQATFRLTSDEGRLQVTETDDAPQVEIGIDALALVTSGSPVDLRRTGLGRGPEEALASLQSLADRGSYIPICDYF